VDDGSRLAAWAVNEVGTAFDDRAASSL